MPDERWAPRVAPPTPDGGAAEADSVDQMLLRSARGDEAAFRHFYDAVIATVWGVVKHVLRDHAQSEEVTQEVLVEVWRTATRFDPARGSALAWVTTIAHRRAVDRVRAEQAASRREQAAADRSMPRPYDEVSEQAGIRLEQQQVRRCVQALTPLQRESVLLAYYRGYTYPEVATLLKVPLGTVKTRMRDGLIRLRDCLGVGR
ncbi:RNA polymerase sigma-70 factor, ECF subfamily [Amycolatopsis arida]|uniref:RNA polymerase sigma-70 factor, ECF subfamily n=1 Tax=Amycolatopsis arida TaxID=587909 RepID=A0A1I5ZDE3_9PSEU|nr:ECF RNA polymerase sigma factor SigK [Amycolatopsis arida]TDX89546.1 RNA polymerase sigma-70 factor (ECF subfamily) [Amycolatopsis arida]SFQ54448.1 RNA polymerase sigma-70 factor, ECF subfamily [Amycolatopsis arida]